MREMSFLPHQDYMMFQSTPQHHDIDNNHQHLHDFNDAHHDLNPISLNMLSSCPPQDLHDQGGRAMVPTLSMMNRSMSFPSYPQNEQEQNNQQEDGEGEDLSDDGSQVVVGGGGGGEKKKRLNMEQVRALEKTFEQGNKLEPDRKVQLAKALGLQPRQVAIWFQNRRARWKTKQLEKDYSSLKRQFEVLKADHDSLLSHNNQLHAQLLSLRRREGTEYGAINLNNADTRSYCNWSNNGSEISSDINLGTSITPQTGSPLSSNPSNKLQFPTNSFIPNSGSINNTQLLPTNKPNLDLHCPNNNNNNNKMDCNSIQDADTFCNLFGGNNNGGVDRGDGGVDQTQPPSFWAWPEQQHLN